ncbi:hypothetical protein GYMLUDRAFT_634285 [Collybiopsis luxurians FD-317 M1]|nr:hypothetical protein GYMLUDRAFT_634285 [Collybiopsis luxurians FD-317 M1]
MLEKRMDPGRRPKRAKEKSIRRLNANYLPPCPTATLKPSLLSPTFSVLPLEILPGAVEHWQTDAAVPFLFIDRNLGIPQKLLYRLYPLALVVFKQSRLSSSLNLYPKSLLDATSIILLANPAHQTALNERKGLVITGHLLPEQELDFASLLLFSSKEASKQSIIWDHRRWLFEKQALVSAALLQRELGIVLRSCESYPRNYYAWAHWDFCLETLYNGCIGDDEADYLPVITSAFVQLLQWVEHHLSDYSAAYHLCRFVQRFQDLKSIQDLAEVDITLACLLEHAVSLVTRYPDHEALWMYLRAVWSAGEDGSFREKMEALVASLPECKYREQCISWFKIVD